MKPWRVFGLENQAGYVAGKPKGRMIFLVVIFFDHRLSTEALSESFGVCRHGFVIPVL